MTRSGDGVKKIPTLFVRDPDDRKHVLPEVTPGCEWVLAGEGQATRKYDGTCVRVAGDSMWARREVKPGKSQPDGFVPVDHDETTGKTVGWVPVDYNPEYDRHWEAWANAGGDFSLDDGTYELVGPKVNGNPEGAAGHHLIRHGDDVLDDAPKSNSTVEAFFEAMKLYLLAADMEGVVWHHPDGRMAKLKKRDFA